MDTSLLSAFSLLCLQIVFCQVREKDYLILDYISDLNRRRTSDLLSTLLSEFENFNFYTGVTFSKQNDPKITFQKDNANVQVSEKSLSEVSNIKTNKKNFKYPQNGLRSPVQISDHHLFSNLRRSAIVQNKRPESSVDISVPTLPIQPSVRSSDILQRTTDDTAKVSATECERVISPKQLIFPSFAANLKIGGSNSMPSTLIPRVSGNIGQVEDKINFDKLAGYREDKFQVNTMKLTNDQISLHLRQIGKQKGLNAYADEFSPRILKETGPLNTDPLGRVLLDFPFTETKYGRFRKLLMNTYSFSDKKPFPSLLIENLKNSKRFCGSTKNKDEEFSNITDENKGDSIQTLTSSNPLYYGSQNNRVKINSVTQFNIEEKIENKLQIPDIILAFTPSGIPLKIKLGLPELRNFNILRKILKLIDVSLYMPVASFDDITPVGEAVLQLGTRKKGIVRRTLEVNVVDLHVFLLFLETLKKHESSSKIGI